MNIVNYMTSSSHLSTVVVLKDYVWLLFPNAIKNLMTMIIIITI